MDLTKSKAITDDISNVVKKAEVVFDRKENNAEKGKKCWIPTFPPFLTMFSKAFFVKVVQSCDCILYVK